MSTAPELAAWIRVDRDELRRECGELLDRGSGILAVVGDSESGRAEAARIAISVLSAAGFPSHIVLGAGDGPSDFCYVLNNIIDWAIKLQADQSGMSASASNAVLSLPARISYCKQALTQIAAAHGNRFAVVVAALGRDTEPEKADLTHLRKFAESIGGCWVVVGPSGDSWDELMSDRIELLDFNRADVTVAIREIIQQRGGDLDRIPQYLEKIFGPNGKVARPFLVYLVLQRLNSDDFVDGGVIL